MKCKKYIISALIGVMLSVYAYGQDIVQGIVYDKGTKQRIARVYIYNSSNDEGSYNNTRGEFELNAKPGDVLIAASPGFFADTLTVGESPTVLIYLERSAIRIQEVSIVVRRSPEERLIENKRTYGNAYSRGNTGPFFSVAPSGAGLSIDALYKLISREGRNARRLQEIIEMDYRESVIDYRFTPDLVSMSTGLVGDKLKDFMHQYRPTYYFVLSANDYNMVQFIKMNYAQYQRNPQRFRLPPLQ